MALRFRGRALIGLAVLLSGIARPAPAQNAPSADAAARIELGRTLFQAHRCGGCHTLAGAGAQGRIGPPLDKDPRLTEEFIIERVTNGSGPMPGLFDQLSEDEIAAIAAYVVHTAAK